MIHLNEEDRKRLAELSARQVGKLFADTYDKELLMVTRFTGEISNGTLRYVSDDAQMQSVIRKLLARLNDEMRAVPASADPPNSGNEPHERPQPAAPQPKPASGAQPAQAVGVWLFPDSSSRVLSASELAALDADSLWRARNEIYARNGLLFTTARGKAFAATLGSTYRGVDTDQDRVSARLNKIEQENVVAIKSLEQNRH